MYTYTFIHLYIDIHVCVSGITVDTTLAQLQTAQFQHTQLQPDTPANQLQAEVGWEILSRFSSCLRCI